LSIFSAFVGKIGPQRQRQVGYRTEDLHPLGKRQGLKPAGLGFGAFVAAIV